jgi:hypothetical protein
MGSSSPVSKLRTATDSSSKSRESFTSLSRFFGDESSSDVNFPLSPSVYNNNKKKGKRKCTQKNNNNNFSAKKFKWVILAFVYSFSIFFWFGFIQE